MYRTTTRFMVAGILLYPMGAGWHTSSAADTQDQSAQVPGEVSKSTDAAETVPPERLPLPRELPSETLISDEPCFFQPPTRINRYDVWQFYEVGRYGRFRPRVIYSAYGSFYLYDGRPFPGISTHPLDFMPRLIGP